MPGMEIASGTYEQVGFTHAPESVKMLIFQDKPHAQNQKMLS